MQHRTLHLPDDIDQFIANMATERKVSFAYVEGMSRSRIAKIVNADNKITKPNLNGVNNDLYEKILAAG